MLILDAAEIRGRRWQELSSDGEGPSSAISRPMSPTVRLGWGDTLIA